MKVYIIILMLLFPNLSFSQDSTTVVVKEVGLHYEITVDELLQKEDIYFLNAISIEIIDPILDQLPPVIFKFKNIIHLELETSILELPVEIEQFEKIESIGCNCPLTNGIKFNPKKLHLLEEITLIGTNFRSIPNKLFCKSKINLIIIDIRQVEKVKFKRNNNINAIWFYNSEKGQILDNSICKIKSLRNISATYEFSSIPKCFDKAKMQYW